jgi:endonuclease/exonuclease/phosphatase family metal-dependent hydrolase
MKDLHIVSWNLKDGLSDPTRTDALQTELLQVGPDIAVLPEAAAEDANVNSESMYRFREAGYTVHTANYDDTDGRKDRHKLVVLAKEDLEHTADILRLAGRTAICVEFTNSDLQFLGVHLDDRNEKTRQSQTVDAIEALNSAAIVAGDFNAMHHADPRAKALRALRPIAMLLPSQNPVPGVKQSKITRIGSIAQRLTGMADGGTLELWKTAGFTDLAADYTPTMLAGNRATVQLDHVLTRGVVVTEPTHVLGLSGSDHHAISARLQHSAYESN